MTPTAQAIRFVQLVALAQPDPAISLERTVVNTARRITFRLRADGLGEPDVAPPRAPQAVTGIPLTRRTS